MERESEHGCRLKHPQTESGLKLLKRLDFFVCATHPVSKISFCCIIFLISPLSVFASAGLKLSAILTYLPHSLLAADWLLVCTRRGTLLGFLHELIQDSPAALKYPLHPSWLLFLGGSGLFKIVYLLKTYFFLARKALRFQYLLFVILFIIIISIYYLVKPHLWLYMLNSYLW